MISTRLASRIEGARALRPAEVRGFGGRVQDARMVWGVSLEFQGLTYPGRTIHALDLSLRSRMSGVEVSGFLGMDLLEQTRIVLDTKTRRVSVENVK